MLGGLNSPICCSIIVESRFLLLALSTITLLLEIYYIMEVFYDPAQSKPPFTG